MDWKEFILQHKDNVIIRIPKEDLDASSSDRVMVIPINEDRVVHDKSSLLMELYEKGRFGGHFGFNWDALVDCLTEADHPELAMPIRLTR